MLLGIDRLLCDKTLRKPLEGQHLAFVGHPASVTANLQHSLDTLLAIKSLKITAAFGPQHGMRGDKQDNMIESDDYIDHFWQIPVFSLYGKVRRPTQQMLDTFDTLIIDLQDIGTRVYTFLTTTCYLLEECARHNKTVVILDRPNPAGRPIEGLLLENGWESFVGIAGLPIRHGLTLGEVAKWFAAKNKLNLDLRVITMLDYNPAKMPDYGWPQTLAWVNPSPNASSVIMTRCYPGTVMLEGTSLSEGRGTTKPLELFGAPDLDHIAIIQYMKTYAPEWLEGCVLRPCYFQPTFNKHLGKLCSGIQIHVDQPFYVPEKFKPFRLISLYLRAIRILYPEYELWRRFPYEYETDRLAFDIITGSDYLRTWITDNNSSKQDLEQKLIAAELSWQDGIRNFKLY